MVAGKVKKVALGFQKSPATPRQAEAPPEKPQSPSPSSGKVSKGAVFSRAFGVYLPRSSSAQVQPRPPPDVAGLLRLVEELRERESRLKTEILEHKLLKESAAIVPLLETQISEKDAEIEALSKGIVSLEAENGRLRAELEAASMEEERRVYEKARIESLEGDNQRLRGELDATMARMEDERRQSEKALKAMESEVAELKKSAAQRDTKASSEESDEFLLSSQRFHHLIDASVKSNLIKNLKKSIKNKVASECTDTTASSHQQQNRKIEDGDARSDEPEPERPTHSRCNSEEITESADSLIASVRSRVPRVPKPPPKPSSSPPSPSSSIEGSMEQPIPPPPPRVRLVPAPPPPPPRTAAPPPPPPLPRAKGARPVPAKVRRVPEVVEFYHSLMRRDSSRRESSAGTPDAQPSAANARDMIGEIENRSAYLLAIKTDVETQGDFIRFLIREVENAAFTNIEDVVPFVKWLDDELSYLVDERAVLKHFSWPEQKADALREAAFGYCDLKKLETEASSFRDDVRQPCGSALKKMQALFEKLEHGVYSLSRMRESATNRYKIFKIPTDWMLESGFACQIKLASVKLAMKYMRRVSAELETGGGGPEEEELIVQGVRFAFRVHQFAGGFDAETMRAFQELRDKAKSCHLQYQNQQHQKFVCRQMTL